jgi:hypothetical protein
MLATQAETAVSQIELPIQNYYRHITVMNLSKLTKNQNSNNNIRSRQEWNIIKNIKQKLNNNSLIKADKGKTLVILPTETYKTKIQDFIQNKQFTKLNTNPTDQYQTNNNTRT